jgi:succinate dehydrogenase / fumarate reductase iron-sulfur subunit
MPEKITVKIKRQEGPEAEAHWETFEIPYQPNMNVISVLMEIRINPVTVDGKRTLPPTWDSGCLEEVCGACSMRINGKPRQACTALVDQLEQPIVLEPFSKFPVVRDLMVDRSKMFENLKRVQAWVPIDGTYPMGPGPKITPQDQGDMYAFSRCITCGCCLEACPQFHQDSPYVGAQTVGQAYLFNKQPGGEVLKDERLEVLMGPGGVGDCGFAQNCARVCPKEIPLVDALVDVSRQLTWYSIKRFFRR